MRKRSVLALMLVAALALTTSCSLIVKDEEVDRQTVIVEAAGKTYTKGEVQDEVEYSLAYQEYLYSMYGLQFDRTDAAVLAEVQQGVIDNLVKQAVLEQKEAEYGTAAFTDEELTEMQTTVDETYQGYIDSVKSSYFADTELEGEELDTAVAEMMVELGYSTKEDMLVSEKSNKAYEKLKAEIVKDVQVTDEEIQTSYDEKVAADKASYEESLPSYGSAVRNGTTVYYNPAGYRYVKNILRKISDEDSATISELSTQVSEKQQELDALGEAESAAVTGEDSATLEEVEATNAEARVQVQSELDALQQQLDAAKETAYAKVQPTIDEILKKLADGGDFDALMEEYGEDDGMKASPAKEQGYLVCEGDTAWVAEFTDAAMALGAVGDVSEPVRTSYGIHLLKYAGDLAEGPVALEDVKDGISEELLTQKQDELFNSTLETWVGEAGAKTYPDRMK